MSWSTRTTYQGRAVNTGTRALLDAANKMLATEHFGAEPEPITMTQGGYNRGGVAQSAGTHDGGGAFDLTAYNAANRVRVLRMLGAFASIRESWEGNWPRHIHAVVDGDGTASAGARQQVDEYHAGRNGLANRAADRFWRPKRLPVLFVLDGNTSLRVAKANHWMRDQPYGAGSKVGVLAKGEKFKPVAVVRNAYRNLWLIDAEGRCVYDKWVTPAAVQAEPNGLVELSKFKRTLPTGKEGKPTELQPLADTASPVTFRAPVDGVTTGGSKYPRDELREIHPKSWSNRSGRHVLTGSCSVVELPGRKPHVVVAQIHDSDDDVLMVRVEGQKVYAEWSKGKGQGSVKVLLLSDYRLGSRLDYEIAATPSGIAVTVNGKKAHKGTTGSGLYFKAGCYTQANSGNGSGAGKVVYYRLTVRHA